MGIRRIAYFFDVEGFRKAFEPVAAHLEKDEYLILRKKAHELSSEGKVLWPLLEDIGYRADDLGRDEEQFDDLSVRIRFWILVMLSSFCEGIDLPRPNARTTREFLELMHADNETILKLTWGRPFGHLLVPGSVVERSSLDRDDSSWPYWSRAYGSLGWLTASEIPVLLRSLKEVLSQQLAVTGPTDIEGLIDLLEAASKKGKGLLLGVSA
jgi:hypothetical protein